MSENKAGMASFASILLASIVLLAIGTLIEISSIGDRPEYKTEDMI